MVHKNKNIPRYKCRRLTLQLFATRQHFSPGLCTVATYTLTMNVWIGAAPLAVLRLPCPLAYLPPCYLRHGGGRTQAKLAKLVVFLTTRVFSLCCWCCCSG
eukprot:scpid114234/ scgid14091/ 